VPNHVPIGVLDGAGNRRVGGEYTRSSVHAKEATAGEEISSFRRQAFDVGELALQVGIPLAEAYDAFGLVGNEFEPHALVGAVSACGDLGLSAWGGCTRCACWKLEVRKGVGTIVSLGGVGMVVGSGTVDQEK
jgi:hypothetical protein